MVEKRIEFIGKEDVKSYPYMLELYGGGYVTTATNYENELESVRVKIDGQVYPKNCDIQLKRLRAPFLLWKTPLDFLGIDAEVEFSSLELSQHFQVGDSHILAAYTDCEGEMQLRVPRESVRSIQCDGSYEWEDERLIINLCIDQRCQIETDSFSLAVCALAPRDAALVDRVAENEVVLIKDEVVKSSQWLKPLAVYSSEVPLEEFSKRNYETTDVVKRIEHYGHYRGYANYRFRFARKDGIAGLLLNEASDVCSAYLNGVYLGTAVTCNNHQYIPIDGQQLRDENTLLIRTEIWGHTNFHDERLPSLHLDSLKGLGGVTLITQQEELAGSWSDDATTLTVHLPGEKLSGALAFLSLSLSDWVLVKINGEAAGHFSRQNSVLDLGAFAAAGGCVIEILSRKPNAVSRVDLLKGELAQLMGVGFVEEADLYALLHESEQVPVELPLRVKQGGLAVLTVDLSELRSRNAYLYPKGRNLKLTAFYDGSLVSRVWLDSPNRPRMVGGNPYMVYLPSCPKQGTGRAVFFIEAINKDEEAVLEDLTVSVLNN